MGSVRDLLDGIRSDAESEYGLKEFPGLKLDWKYEGF